MRGLTPQQILDRATRWYVWERRILRTLYWMFLVIVLGGSVLWVLGK